MPRSKLQWISSSGGPLVVLPESLLEHWSGVDPPADGRRIDAKARWDPARPATDYDRACDVEDPIAALELGAESALVIGGEPPMTAFVPRPDGGLLVGWIDGGSEQELLRYLEGREFESDTDAVAMIDVRPGPLLVFDAACPGVEVEEDRLVLDLHPGRYMASATPSEPGATVSLSVIRLQRVG
jgi:hypothetical protein